jgi:Uma2 family endonuclease
LRPDPLSFDRRRKGSVYALAGIPEYWILNLKQARLEVRREPAQREEGAYGWDYASLNVLAPGQSVSPLFEPRTVFSISIPLGLDPG